MMPEWMTRLTDNALELTIDARFAYSALSITAISILLLHFAELWGRARARRLTRRAIAQTEREGPPKAHTWEHAHSAEKN